MPQKTWSFITGEQGRNRVRVYERYPGGPIQIDTWASGERKRESLRRLAGSPVRDKYLAKQIARRVAEELDQRQHEADIRVLLGVPQRRSGRM